MMVWEILVDFEPDIAFCARANDNEWFNSQYKALKWREALTARIKAIYWFEFAPPRGIIPDGPLVHNKPLTKKVNDYAEAFDGYDLKWGQKKEDKLRLWMYACRGFNCNWVDKLEVHLGRGSKLFMGN